MSSVTLDAILDCGLAPLLLLATAASGAAALQKTPRSSCLTRLSQR